MANGVVYPPTPMMSKRTFRKPSALYVFVHALPQSSNLLAPACRLISRRAARESSPAGTLRRVVVVVVVVSQAKCI